MSYPIGLQITVSGDGGATFSQVGWFATRSAISTPPGVTGSPTVVAPATQNCGGGAQQFSPAVAATFAVTATTSTLVIRYTYWAQNRTCGTFNPNNNSLCSGSTVTPNDDIGATPPVWASCR